MDKTVFDELKDAIIDLDMDKAVELARAGLDDGVNPLEIINQAIRPGLDLVGERFSVGEVFLPELILAAKTADAVIKIIEPELLKVEGAKDAGLGKVLLVTVKGDIHDIGKNIVGLVMKSAGFEVIDIGADKSEEEIFEAAEQNGVAVIGLSALLTTTMPNMQKTIDYFQEKGARDKYKFIIGGAPITQEFCREIGADGYGADAISSVEATKDLLGIDK